MEKNQDSKSNRTVGVFLLLVVLSSSATNKIARCIQTKDNDRTLGVHKARSSDVLLPCFVVPPTSSASFVP